MLQEEAEDELQVDLSAWNSVLWRPSLSSFVGIKCGYEPKNGSGIASHELGAIVKGGVPYGTYCEISENACGDQGHCAKTANAIITVARCLRQEETNSEDGSRRDRRPARQLNCEDRTVAPLTVVGRDFLDLRLPPLLKLASSLSTAGSAAPPVVKEVVCG
uniref:Uncharacterized protein n=1 Tax=Steinernema glaseri TaxID=37863 RepID=A0A1I7YE02_9BILA